MYAEDLVLVHIWHSSLRKQIIESEAQTESCLDCWHNQLEFLIWAKLKDNQFTLLSLTGGALNTAACSGRPYLERLKVNLFHLVCTKQLNKS